MPDDFRLGDWLVQPSLSRATRQGRSIHLRAKVMDLLVFLASRPGQVVSKDEILNEVWRSEFVSESALTRVVAELRQAFDDDVARPAVLETIAKRGYRLIAPVIALPASPSPGDPVPQRSVDASVEPAKSASAAVIGSVAAVVLAAAVVAGVLAVRSARSSGGAGSVAASIRSIAVLPFTNLSGDADQEYFVDGVTDALTTELGALETLRVTSITSVMPFKKADRKLPDVARALGVEGIIEGSVVREGQQVRVSVRLIHGPTDTLLWSDTFERELGGIPFLQVELARLIASEIHLTVATEQKRISAQAVDPEAYELYLRGRYHLGRFTPSDAQRAQECFEAAIREDPNMAGAYAGLADIYLRRRAGLPAVEWYVGAKNATLRALELDPTLAEAYASLAEILFWYDWDWRGSDTAARKALQFNPNHRGARVRHAVWLAGLGQLDEAMREALRARDLNPMSAEAHVFVGDILSVSGRHEEAFQWARKALALDPDFTAGYGELGWFYSRAGRYEDAADASGMAFSRQPRPMNLVRLVYALAMANRRREADQAFTTLQALQETRYVSPYFLAVARMGFGDRDGALDLLEKGLASRDALMPALRPDSPIWSTVRDDPRFSRIVEQMNFPGGYPR